MREWPIFAAASRTEPTMNSFRMYWSGCKLACSLMFQRSISRIFATVGYSRVLHIKQKIALTLIFYKFGTKRDGKAGGSYVATRYNCLLSIDIWATGRFISESPVYHRLNPDKFFLHDSRLFPKCGISWYWHNRLFPLFSANFDRWINGILTLSLHKTFDCVIH
jgi:hypothetical protein